MKRILALLLVAVVAAGAVFASVDLKLALGDSPTAILRYRTGALSSISRSMPNSIWISMKVME